MEGGIQWYASKTWLPFKQVWIFVRSTATMYIVPTGWDPTQSPLAYPQFSQSCKTLSKPCSTAIRSLAIAWLWYFSSSVNLPLGGFVIAPIIPLVLWYPESPYNYSLSTSSISANINSIMSDIYDSTHAFQLPTLPYHRPFRWEIKPSGVMMAWNLIPWPFLYPI